MAPEENRIKAIALYLPQFHPIPENDKWWGKGFTEWTNVTKARSLFKGHWQPRLPADLGFYDLRVPEVREAQANLAKEFGIYGFCYWHYWFGGKRILERPFTEVIKSGKPDFPFCIAWANQTWKGTWHGLSNKEVLIEQTYPGKEDYSSHFYSLLEAFWDKRYIEVKGKKMVYIFQPLDFSDPREFIDCWQELAIKEGLNGLHFVAMHMPPHWQLKQYGYDAMLADGMMELDKFIIPRQELAPARIWNKFFSKKPKDLLQRFSYREYVKGYPWQPLSTNQYPWVMPDWDNTPRTPTTGWLFLDSSPELFGDLCMKAFRETENKPEDEKIVILKSWNEWAEGNYLEPDSKYGTAYLENFRNALYQYSNLSLL
jgi:hypothetical protein